LQGLLAYRKVDMNILAHRLGERTRLAKTHSRSESLRITVPQSMVNQWDLKEGDELDWSWQAKNNEMVLVVRRVGQTDSNLQLEGREKSKMK
jgi:antitoxin component of MazEF toxin-antitoxin module